MSQIKDQDTCADCWAYASTGVTTGLLQQYIGSVQGEHGISLDEFYMANTATCSGNCEAGGTWLCGLSYILNNKLRSEQGLNQFPNYDHALYTISSYTQHDWNTVSIDAIKASLVNSPIFASMDVYDDFPNYPGGIYQHVYGVKWPNLHAVVILGYDDDSTCWICRNSWGFGWGEKEVGDPDLDTTHKGYFRIHYGQCNIDSYGYVTATVENDSCFAKLIPNFQTIDGAFNSSFVSDEWSYALGNASATSNITVPSGVTFQANPGVSLTFHNGTSLIVNGIINATGTSSQPITFTSANSTPAPGDWTGIVLQSGSNTIQYCNISYAVNGLFFYTNLTNTISNCTIQNCQDYGIKINGQSGYGSVSVQNSTISNNTAGLTVYAGWLDLINSSCISNTGYGCWLWPGGTLCPSNSSISGNGNIGVFTYDATAYLRCSIDGRQAGNDYIQNNHGGQIYIAYGGAWLGERRVDSSWICPGGGGGVQSAPGLKEHDISQHVNCYWQVTVNWYGGWNHLSGDYSWVADAPGITIKAHNNYWGPPCPPPQAAFVGPVDYSYYLPCQGNSSTVQTINTTDRVNENKTPNSPASITDDDLLTLIKSLYRDVTNGEAGIAINALRHLALFVGPGGRFPTALPVSWNTLLLNISSLPSYDADLRSLAKAYLIHWKLAQGDYDGAITLVNAVINANPTDEYWMNAQTMLVSAYLYKGDITSAQDIYNQMKNRGNSINVYATSHIAELINDERTFGSSVTKRSLQIDSGSVAPKKQIPSNYVLMANYPNPFNPITTIQYALPEDVNVVLKVFNVLGMDVKTLIDEHETAGYKSISFDGSNFPSGVYFYRLQAGKFADVKKMLLIK